METIRTVQKEGIQWIYFNRPERHNAFSRKMLAALLEVLQAVEQDDSVNTVVITGEGKSFSSGVDLQELTGLNGVEQARDFALLLEETSEKIFRLNKPVIAAVNGLALGGGAGFAAAADIRVLSASARIGFPAVKLGAILPAGCTVYLESLIGRGRTMDWLMTGKMLTAAGAFDAGFAEYVTEPENLENRVMEIAGQIREGAALALALTKRTVNFPFADSLETSKLYAVDNFAFLSATEEWKTRMENFSKKKKK
jgi:enoyl-CoA hydratase/carnithine racemase